MAGSLPGTTMFDSQTSSLTSSNISANGNVNLNAAGRDVVVYNGTCNVDQILKVKRETLARLSQRNYKAIQRDTFSKVAKNTGNWFLCSSEYREWRAKSRGVLWGAGIAGAGKTFLSSTVINELEDHAKVNPTFTVIYSYCRFEDSLTEYDILASLLRQLAENSDVIYRHIEINFEDLVAGNSETLLEADILLALKAGLKNFSKVFIIIDALDELVDEVRDRLLEILLDLPALIFLTSRPIQLIDKMRPNFFIHAHKEEVKTFVREELQRLPKLRGFLKSKPDVMDDVASTIEQKSKGMFLLARLQLNALRNIMTVKKLVATVKNLPQTISELYKTTLQRINEQSGDEKEMAFRALIWVTHSYRPLKVQELLYGIAASPDSDTLDSDDLISESTLLSICFGLITIEQENDIVRLSHYTAHEFFMSYTESHFSTPHWCIADSCARCLSILTSGGKAWPSKASFQALEKKCDLWSYACVFYGYHLRLATTQQPSKRLSLHTVKLLQKSQLLPLQVREGDYRWCDYGSAIHFAAKNGILPAFDFLQHPWNAKSRNGITPLMYAAANGHLEIVQRLLQDDEVDINRGNSSHSGSALSRACIHGHKDIVKLLLARQEINVNVRFWSQFILHAVILHGDRAPIQLEILELLLEHPGLQIDTVDHEGGTVLHCAVAHGDNSIVRLLLQKGCIHQINAKDLLSRTPLDVGKAKHRKEICETLQNSGGQSGLSHGPTSAPMPPPPPASFPMPPSYASALMPPVPPASFPRRAPATAPMPPPPPVSFPRRAPATASMSPLPAVSFPMPPPPPLTLPIPPYASGPMPPPPGSLPMRPSPASVPMPPPPPATFPRRPPAGVTMPPPPPPPPPGARQSRLKYGLARPDTPMPI